jgi:hypothetical protein
LVSFRSIFVDRLDRQSTLGTQGLIMIAIGLAAFVSPAQATTGPGCLTVVNVADDEVLYIRAKPAATSRIVEVLVPNQHGILHLDAACGPKNLPWSSRWCPVTYYGGDSTVKGWVKARFVRDSECP